MKYTEKVSDKLNELLEKNYDAEAGYKAAAKNVEHKNLKKFFEERAQDRFEFGNELKDEIKFYGKEPEEGTSWKGDAHRAWMNLKSTFSSNSEETILEEAIKGEKAAIEEYDEILAGTILASSTKKVLDEQRNSVKAALEDIKVLEDIS